MKLEKEELLFCRHITELAKSAYHKGICVYTDFLNLNEISIFHTMEKELAPLPYSIYGGYVGAERVKLCFHGDIESKSCLPITLDSAAYQRYPIDCLHIVPVSEKFAGVVDHRDYLGAILNVGTKRCKIGDIVMKNKQAYCYCDRVISEFIQMNLDRVRHTNIKIEKEDSAIVMPPITRKELIGSVSSFRLDTMISLAFHTSRSSITGLITGEKVFVNSRLVTSNSYMLKQNDIVSVRGFGKFQFLAEGGISKKGRRYVTLSIYQ